MINAMRGGRICKSFNFSYRARALTRPAAVVGAKRGGSARRHGNASSRRSGIVIGRTAKALFE